MIETRPVIVYDGECRFCLWSVGRIRRFDRNGRFEYLPRQTAGIEERFPVLSSSDFNTGLRLIHAGGQVDVGADAVYQIYRRASSLAPVRWGVPHSRAEAALSRWLWSYSAQSASVWPGRMR